MTSNDSTFAGFCTSMTDNRIVRTLTHIRHGKLNGRCIRESSLQNQGTARLMPKNERVCRELNTWTSIRCFSRAAPRASTTHEQDNSVVKRHSGKRQPCRILTEQLVHQRGEGWTVGELGAKTTLHARRVTATNGWAVQGITTPPHRNLFDLKGLPPTWSF
jgi:hypothetical protein